MFFLELGTAILTTVVGMLSAFRLEYPLDVSEQVHTHDSCVLPLNLLLVRCSYSAELSAPKPAQRTWHVPTRGLSASFPKRLT